MQGLEQFLHRHIPVPVGNKAEFIGTVPEYIDQHAGEIAYLELLSSFSHVGTVPARR
jgi:hypothetical protein